MTNHTITKTEPSSCVDRFLAAVEGAAMTRVGVFAADATLDATVPHWRMQVAGEQAIEDTFAGWFADPGRFEELERTPTPDGELVRFTLCWEEHGVPHAAHQVHVLVVSDDRIVADQAWCGGRWPASLLAEMGATSVGS